MFLLLRLDEMIAVGMKDKFLVLLRYYL